MYIVPNICRVCTGIPQQIVSDNGTEFNNETVKELLSLHKIKVHFTTPYHYESNSIVERFHSTIIEHLRILKETYPDEKLDLIDYAIIGYNISIHSATKFTPFELTFGHTNSRNPNEIFVPKSFYTDYVENHNEKLKHVYSEVNEKLQNQKKKIVSKRNTKGNDNEEFKIGKIVYKKNPQDRNKKNNKFIGPYEISKTLDRNRVEIREKRNKNKKEIVHIKELKKMCNVTDSPSVSQWQD